VSLEERFVDHNTALQELIIQTRERCGNRCALDTEADSLHSYREKLCLVQMAWPDGLLLLDPLSSNLSTSGLSEFFRALNGCELWFHGADFDMTLLLRTFGSLPDRILDTQLAARLIGEEKFGLADLIQRYFQIELSKSSQKADWGRRPLSEKMLRYAYDDVRYLLQLADRLSQRLHELGRWSWFEEWCSVSRRNVLQRKERPADEAWRVTGWGKLERKALCFLRALWQWRDEEAERSDCPPFRVVPNPLLLHLAQRAAEGGNVRGARGLSGAQSERFRRAIATAASLPADQWPLRRIHRTGERLEFDPEVYNRLREVRDSAARRLQLDPTVIATRGVLESLAMNRSGCDELLMSWQRELMLGASQSV
jgi:ribonuclease D